MNAREPYSNNNDRNMLYQCPSTSETCICTMGSVCQARRVQMARRRGFAVMGSHEFRWLEGIQASTSVPLRFKRVLAQWGSCGEPAGVKWLVGV